MTSYGFCFCPALDRRDRPDCSGTLQLWVADYRGATRFAPTRYDISRDEWNPVTGCIVLSTSDMERRYELLVYARGMVQDLRLVERIIRELEVRGRYCADDVLRRWQTISLATI